MKKNKRGKRLKPTRVERVSLDLTLPIVADGALAGPVAEGSLVPVLIVDTTRRPDIEELIRVHQFVSSGDVTSQWGLVEKHPDTVGIMFDFHRPIQARAVVTFSIEAEAILVESALAAKAIYLQSGNVGDIFSQNLDKPRILIEVPADDFRAKWDEVFLQRMTDVLRVRSGITRKEAEPHARELIRQLKSFTNFRLPR
ncbi:hypothetical protein [Micromonospora purpureochromogenes]|uniref:Uncharacterized protein n=1 Tax=Micromonospora purpureochromogenes TaxID=47872 RepID=A0ABX2RJW2_9ACTN|nr:hypothetical protein [Micromonospora purpureochromogenes]NYF56566.1 hypothetical protein [Micromonospora purpureochromogenes]